MGISHFDQPWLPGPPCGRDPVRVELGGDVVHPEQFTVRAGQVACGEDRAKPDFLGAGVGLHRIDPPVFIVGFPGGQLLGNLRPVAHVVDVARECDVKRPHVANALRLGNLHHDPLVVGSDEQCQ